MSTPELDAFIRWAEVRSEPREPGECLVWTGAAVNDGTSPRGCYLGEKINVRRKAWQLAHPDRALPGNRPVVAKCTTPLCVEPEHMLLERHSFQNRGRKLTLIERAKLAATARANQSRVPQEVVNKVKLDPRPARAIAAELGVDKSTVNNWRRGFSRVDFEGDVFAARLL